MSLNSTQSLELSVDAYCTLSQIQAYMPAVRDLDSTSKPTRNQAVDLSRDVFQEVNGLLDMLGYVIPVGSSNTTAIRIVGRVNALGAAAAIEAAAYSAGNQEDSEHADSLLDQYSKAWTRLEKGQLRLPNANRQTNYVFDRRQRKATYSFWEDSTGDEHTPRFKRSMDW